MRKNMMLISAIALMGMVVGACQAAPPAPSNEVPNAGDPIIVGSFVDTEGGILGNMILLALEAKGYEVTDKVQFGTPDVHRNALLQGELHVGVDYTGNGQFYIEGTEESIWRDAAEGYETIKNADEANGLLWLTPAKANNTEALAVKREFSETNNIKTMEDFAKYVNEGGEVKFITSQLFAEKQVGLLGLEEAYGFKLQPDQLILLPHGNTAETLKGLSEGRDGINVALAYATDGSLVDLDLVILEDPLSIPPVYEPAPILREEVAEKYPEVKELLDGIFSGLTKELLQEMNKKVIVDGLSPRDVAEEYLKNNNIIE